MLYRASRCFGCSHIAQASFRLTKTMMSLGYAAGNALSQCVINNIENNMKVVGVPAKSLHDIGGIVNQIGLLCNERRFSYAA